jgi:hypothetical protein
MTSAAGSDSSSSRLLVVLTESVAAMAGPWERSNRVVVDRLGHYLLWNCKDVRNPLCLPQASRRLR